MLQDRIPQDALIAVEIDFGTGSRACEFYDRLHNHIPTMKHVLRQMGNSHDALVMYLWTRTSRYQIREANTWVMELEADEWQALSRGLRHTGTKGRTLLAWIDAHKENTHA